MTMPEEPVKVPAKSQRADPNREDRFLWLEGDVTLVELPDSVKEQP